MAESVLVLNRPEQAAKVLTALRLRILGRLGKPESATTLAKALELTRQQLNYHLRELEEVGAIEISSERLRGNFLERMYRLKADSILVGPGAIGELAATPDSVPDQSAPAYLPALGARLIDELDRLHRSRGKVPTLAIETSIRFTDDRDRAAFAAELTETFRRLAA